MSGTDFSSFTLAGKNEVLFSLFGTGGDFCAFAVLVCPKIHFAKSNILEGSCILTDIPTHVQNLSIMGSVDSGNLWPFL